MSHQGKGLRILIQKSFTEEQKFTAEVFALRFLKDVVEHHLSWKHLTKGGHKNGSPLTRGVVGIGYPRELRDNEIIFRRWGRRTRTFVFCTASKIFVPEQGKFANELDWKRFGHAWGHLKAEVRDLHDADFYQFAAVGAWKNLPNSERSKDMKDVFLTEDTI